MKFCVLKQNCSIPLRGDHIKHSDWFKMMVQQIRVLNDKTPAERFAVIYGSLICVHQNFIKDTVHCIITFHVEQITLAVDVVEWSKCQPSTPGRQVQSSNSIFVKAFFDQTES